ncbi:phosphonate C-P lyase system protein PhnL [Sinorhizobium meliloti]|uniref:phosphonate C-P lyase system protein PhnL n=1 Tax=Rhizobium meliloti TaxID=382 RepID=UPI000FD9C29D|nr:ATP-binding cassette domain-containing protein [Sinorhizobium meliloti]RVM17902.1 ATP-binding cassette domain-containing protein [Sinorhizobium meliloti]RVO34188.1 ATP-binding cassette domain-containing protein [Sinorhizobium meliloti]
MENLLTVKRLTKAFEIHHLGHIIPAFATLSFSVAPGEFLLLSGPNGVGKSTLLRTLYRTYRPMSGHVWYTLPHGQGRIDLARAADIDIALLRRREIGFVTQFLAARPRVSAEDVVAEPLLQAGTPLQEAHEEARHWLETFGVKRDLWAAYPMTFSGGEQQKVNLARALIRPQRLVLLDEPTASLDAQARGALVVRLADLKAEGVAMIGVFHHPGDVETLVDREILLQPMEMANVA